MKKLVLLLLTLCLLPAAAYAANGSSVIGNMPGLTDWLKTGISPSGFKLVGDRIVDSKTGEPLLKTEPVQISKYAPEREKFARSTFGAVKGYEYTPTSVQAQNGAQNFWIACQDGISKNCVQLSPLSRTNIKVMTIIGTLHE